MFSSSSTSANIALETDPSIAGSEDGFDDDATEFSMQPSLFNTTSQLSPGGTNNNRGGNIRLEGWLYHTTSSYKDNTTTTNTNTNTVVPPPTSSSSYISKTVSKKRKKRSNTKQRYFVLRGSTISYYARRHDIKAKGTYVLTQGCTVGPVVYSSLDDSAQAAASVATTTENNQQQQQNEESVPPSPAANNNIDTPPAKSSSKKQKKQRQFYCVQVTWPTNNKPSKDEKFIAQAKAQVAAESEKEALQQQKLELDISFDENRASLDPRILNTGGSRSPIMRPKQLMRRSKSDNQQSSSGSPSKVPARRSNSDDLPPELSAPNLSSEDEQQKNIEPVSSSLLPVSELKETAPLTTPAMALAGSVVLPKLSSSEKASVENNNNTDKLNHETGLHKHYKHQIEKHTRDQEKSAAELQKVQQLISKKESHQKTKRRVIQGTKVAAVSTVAITTGVLTAGIGLAAGLVFVGITAAAGGSGAVVGSKVLDKARGKYNAHQSQKSFHLIIGASTYEEAVQWKMAMEHVIKELADEAEDTSDEQWVIAQVLSGENAESPSAPLSPPRSPRNGTARGMATTNDNNRENIMYHDMTPKWVPIQGGGMALWGILGALGGGGGNVRIYREERSPNAPFQQQQSYMSTLSTSSPYWLFTQPQTSAFPTIPRFRSDVGLAGQPFPPFKASISLKANSLDAFMCLMCSGRIQNDTVNDRIPVPNSGQIASFRIIETMDDHMDVIHLVFRPLYLFPSWTAPRDFVLYRFWKYDDDGTYQICFDSCEHRDCPAIMGYQRGEMHSVYTIAPLKQKKKKRGPSAVPSDTSSSAADSNQECLLSHVIQIDPRGWVPTTTSLPFVRSQGYGDAFTIMGLLQMLDVKEALDTARFAIPQSSNRPPVRLNKGKAGLVRNRSGGGGRQQQQQIYMPSLERNESVDMSDDEADYDMYSGHYSGDGYHQSPPLVSSTTDNVVNTNSGAAEESKQEGTTSSNNGRAMDLSSISSIPSPTISDWWDEPDANSFRVRGKTYKTDNKKVNAGRSLFRLFATDIVEVDVPIMTGMCLHPNERVQLALQREREKAESGDSTSSTTEMPPFVFAVNINMPGPPHYHMVFYYAVDDMSKIDGSDGTPSSQLCQEFFFGKDDTFRDNTFKLIPHIVEGNFMVRKAVGLTPAIMGNKIKQTYVQGERFFELIIDTGSSSVAAGVIRICNGYAKMIVVDLAFLFEGYDERTLPEKVLGCIRLKNVEFGKKLRFVESPL